MGAGGRSHILAIRQEEGGSFPVDTVKKKHDIRDEKTAAETHKKKLFSHNSSGFRLVLATSSSAVQFEGVLGSLQVCQQPDECVILQ